MMMKKLKTETNLKNDDTIENPAMDFPVVGIGASAGGLAAFEAFFSGMPLEVDPDMAFVLIQHLSPDHTSALADIIQRYTRMKVIEVQDGMQVEPNCTYIIPPGYDMAFLHGKLQLIEPSCITRSTLHHRLFLPFISTRPTYTRDWHHSFWYR
jgi:two-component system CheB/CheR fusion protein